MATAVTSLTVKSTPQFVQSNGITLVPRVVTDLFSTGLTFSSGTGANQINRLVIQTIPIVLSGTQVIDLTSGAYTDGTNSGTLKDLNNEAVTFSALKYLRLRLVDASSGSTSVLLDLGGANAWPGCGGNAVAAGTGSGFEGTLEWCNPSAAGETVTNSSTDTLNIVNGSAIACTVVLILGGLA